MSKKNTYLKFIEITPGHMYSEITNEVNCPDNAEGRKRVEALQEESRKNGRVGVILNMDSPDSFVNAENSAE